MAYVYIPLRSKEQEIRLFDLDPWRVSSSDPIELRMVTTELGLAGDYVCLSYTWGEPTPKYGIKIDGCDFEIQKNLHTALLRLRLGDCPRRLWADAVCINQEDVAEREAQVSIMQHIYHSATKVIAWIGEDNGLRDERAIEFLHQLSSRAQQCLRLERSGEDTVKPSIASARYDKETLAWIESVTPLGFMDSIWLDFTALLSRPWFSRIWIVQEVVMGKSVTVQCGRHELEWMDIVNSVFFVKRHDRVIMRIAAPQCLESHDSGRYRFFFQEKPGYHLLEATQRIGQIANMLFRRQLQSRIVDIARSAVDSYLKQVQNNSNQPGHLLGSWSPDMRMFRLVDLAPLLSNMASRRSPSLDPPLQEPNFVNRHLPESESADKLVAMVDGKIPIWTTRTSVSTDECYHRSLWSLVREFRTFDATDPRDKIYALVGLAAEVEHITSLPSISYQATLFEAFYALIEADLRGSGNVSFLSDACGLDRPEGFPSWMPLWYDNSDEQNRPASFDMLERKPHVLFRAAGNTQLVASANREEKILNVSGVFVGRIERVGDVYDRDADSAEVLNIAAKWADIAGVGGAERVAQRLVRRVEEGKISAKESVLRLQNYVQHMLVQNIVYEEFQAVQLASVCRAGLNSLRTLAPEWLIPVVGHTLPNGQRMTDCGTPEDMFMMSRKGDVCHGRRFVVCNAGKGVKKFGLAPRTAQVGDKVVLFLGAKLLSIIRKTDTVDGLATYGLVGDAYVHGWMSGELLVGSEASADGDIRLR
jgi:hypothetical protein